jgi:hypothetical protein
MVEISRAQTRGATPRASYVYTFDFDIKLQIKNLHNLE